MDDNEFISFLDDLNSRLSHLSCLTASQLFSLYCDLRDHSEVFLLAYLNCKE